METKNIKRQFNSNVDIYDSGRRYFIPCFNDYYETGVNILSLIKNDYESILDLGAGTGLLTKYLYEKFPTAQFTLVDVAEKMLDIAKVRFRGKNNFTYNVADYSAELPSRDFDLIASALSIHHLDEDEKRLLYSLIYDKLPKGGCFLNLDQFNASSDIINETFNKYWYDYIIHSGITKEEIDRWTSRKGLDKESTVRDTISMLKEIGFDQSECVYQYLKFGVIVAVK